MKNVLFLVRKDKISIRRYILVARQLKKLNIGASFLNLTDHRFIVKETIEELGLSDFSEYRVYSRELLDIFHLAIARIKKHTLRKFGNTSINNTPINTDQQVPGRDNFENLLGQLNFNTDAIVKQYYDANIDWWEASVTIVRNKITKIKPDCIVYDLEMLPIIRAFLFVAKEEKIPVISMQHGEGFSEQYSNFSRLADYYIAYSLYSFEKIKNLQVQDKDIYLTGMPDTDLIYEYDFNRIKEDIRLRYAMDCDRKIILVALRPANLETFNEINMALINAVAKIFGNNEEFYILIKPHNVDYGEGIPFQYKKLSYKNFRIIDSDYPFSMLLKISQYVITHLSSCVVEAASMGVSTIVIDFDSGGIWPPWGAYKTFNNIPFSQLEQVLNQIKNNTYDFKCAEEVRKQFVERFRFKYDNKSSERIAGVIKHIIEEICH